MIKLIPKEETLHIGTCNACSECKAIVELKFKSKYNSGGLIVALCKNCIKELQTCLNAIALPKEDV